MRRAEPAILVACKTAVIDGKFRWVPPAGVTVGIQQAKVVLAGNTNIGIGKSADASLGYENTRNIEPGEFNQTGEWMYYADTRLDDIIDEFNAFQCQLCHGAEF